MMISIDIPSGSWRHKSSSVTANKVTSGGSWCPSAYSINIKYKILNNQHCYQYKQEVQRSFCQYRLSNQRQLY